MSYPSIFNDVIGPVMRGPSSSHTAASVRIGRMSAELLGEIPVKVLCEFDPAGSLATTYDGQGSDIGLAGGLMGYSLDDDRLPDALKHAYNSGMKIEVKITPFRNNHPNTYKLTLWDKNDEKLTVTAISTGGGMISIVEIDGRKTTVSGDYYEFFVFCKIIGKDQLQLIRSFCKEHNIDGLNCSFNSNGGLINAKSAKPFTNYFLSSLCSFCDVSNVRQTSPILPVKSRKGCNVPFLTAVDIDHYAREHSLNQLWELAVVYEAERGGISAKEVFEMMRGIVVKIKDSLISGLEGTNYDDRILSCQIHKFLDAMSLGRLLPSGLINSVVGYTISMMEVKSSMGVIVAAPTAGSCAVLPGAVFGTAKELDKNLDDCTKAMLSAGLIGVLISYSATFAAEVGGCQAECGSASGMAAAGIVELAGGNYKEAMAAASFALQNTLGLICDPVANRVEVPCMSKNVMGATNAISSATMALAGIDPVIPLDEVISTMNSVGKMIPCELRCTGYGGLSITRTAKQIESRLKVQS